MNWFFSAIAWRELIVCGVVLFLLSRLPPHSIAGRIVAALSGCVIVAIIVALFVVDLNRDTVLALSTLGLGLALGLLDWRSRIKVSREQPQSTP
jgi:hypothetical protein